jgi:hypothetical protein
MSEKKGKKLITIVMIVETKTKLPQKQIRMINYKKIRKIRKQKTHRTDM